MTGSALDTEKAVPKSITLTFKGSGRCFDTMMLLGCKSPWISPMLARASSALATLKIKYWNGSQNSLTSKVYDLCSGDHTCWTIALISFRGRGDALTRYWSRFISSHSNTITCWWNNLNVPKYFTILRWSNLRFINASIHRICRHNTYPKFPIIFQTPDKINFSFHYPVLWKCR